MVAKPRVKEKADIKTRPEVIVLQKTSDIKTGILEIEELNKLLKYYDIIKLFSQQRDMPSNFDRTIHFMWLRLKK